jgi:hypothetical protein
MYFCLRLSLAMVALASCVLAQEAEPAAAPVSPKAASTAPVPAPISLAPDASGNVSAEQVRTFLLQAEEKDLENEKRLRDYTYLERQVEHKLDGHGNVAKTEVRTSEILEIYGEQVEKLIAKDDKPLSAEEAKKEDDKLQKVIDRRKHESEDDRRKRVEKEEKRREEARKFVLEVADAFNFRLVGSELIDGHDTWMLDGEPRPGYEPKRREAKFLSKFRGRVWIDKAEAQWVKLDITAIDTIAFGVFLARIHKGAHVLVEQTRVNDEVWLPKHIELRVDARVALVKNYREEIELTFRDYKKFRAETKITVVGETQ